MNPFRGVILYVNRPTTDGRTVSEATWTPPIPVDRLASEDAGPNRLIGRVDRVELLPDGSVHATGEVDLEPGDYPCGVSLTDLQRMCDRGGVTSMSGRIGNLVIYTGDTQPAWPDARITVTEAAS